MLQVANVRNPNSKHNTCLLTVAECKDTPDNLRRILSPYKDQIETLKIMQWDGKRVRLFLFGDYDFLLKPYGLSGAQSVHPCLYCLASKAQIHPSSTRKTSMNATWHKLREITTSFAAQVDRKQKPSCSTT